MDDPFINFAFAALAVKQGKPAVAVTYLERATKLAPNFAWGFRTKGFLKQRLLNAPADAEAAYEEALAVEPDMPDAVNALVDLRLVRNNFDGAIDAAQAAIKRAPRDADNYYRVAQIYIQQWRLREAAEQLRKAIALQPNSAKYYRTRASIERYQGNFTEAIDDFRKAVELSADKKFELIELAALEIATGKDDDATGHLLEALTLDPTNQRASDQLVRLLTRRGKFDQLVTVLKGLVDKNPKNAGLRMYLGDVLVTCGKVNEALEQYKEAANLNQTDAEPHRKAGAILVAQSDFRQAAKEYTRALNISPNSTADLVALGFCYGQTDDYLQAEAAYVTALALHQLTQPADSNVPPTRLDIMRSLATLLFKEGRYADAASQFNTVCSLGKSLPTAGLDRFMLAQANALRDRSSASFRALKIAFDQLEANGKAALKVNYIDTLIRGEHFDDALALLAELTSEELQVKQGGTEDKTDKNTPGKEDNVSAPKDQLKTISAKDNPLILICWARAWRGKNDIAKAEEAARKAVEISAQSGAPLSDALCELGEILLTKNDCEGAIKNARRALEINEKSFRAHDLLGRVSLKSGQPKTAIEEANKALQIDPYFTEGYLLLGDAQAATNDLKGMKEAASTYQKAVDLYPGLLKAHQSLVGVLKKLSLKDEVGREEAAITQLKNQQ
jgi:tetratricopeptide (TPR) repeat protein